MSVDDDHVPKNNFIFTDIDNQPLTCDNNPARFEGLLAEIADCCKRARESSPICSNTARRRRRRQAALPSCAAPGYRFVGGPGGRVQFGVKPACESRRRVTALPAITFSGDILLPKVGYSCNVAVN
jgi:hypothetical protein